MPLSIRVSAVVTAFQCEAFLGEALDSILSQSVTPEEIVVVDDGSTDGTASVARSFSGPVRLVSRPNGGPGAARNTGVVAARGDWIAFLDGDDAWTPDKTRLQLDAAAADPSLDLVFGYAQNCVARRGTSLAEARGGAADPPVPGLVAGSMLARRETLRSVGPFPEGLKLGEFIDWYARAQEARVASRLLHDVVLLRRIHGANQTVRHQAAAGDYVRVLKAAIDRRRGGPSRGESA